jgi:hypothetical protein
MNNKIRLLLMAVIYSFSMAFTIAQQDHPIITGTIDDNNPYETIPFVVEEDGSTIIIDIKPTSGDLDTYLFLLDASGNILTANDNRARGDFSSLIEFPQTESGNYSIIATRYKVEEGSSSGDFILEVTIGAEQHIEQKAYATSPEDLIAVGFPEQEVKEEAEWTILVYYGGDNSLEPGIMYDFDEFEMYGGSNDNLRVVALVDRNPEYTDADGDWDSTRLYEISADSTGDHEDVYPPTIDTEYLADLGEMETDNGETLAQFLTWGIRHYPAKHYVIAFGSHGAGWQGLITDDTSHAEVGGYPSILSLPELQQAFEIATAEAGVAQFEMLINDACLMSSIEYFSALSQYFRYSLASPEIVVNPALDMTMFMQLLNESSDPVNFNVIGTQLVEQYITKDILYQESPDVIYLTHSLTDLDNFDPVVEATENFASVINRNPNIHATMIGNARSNTYTYTSFMGGNTKVDLGSFMKRVILLSTDSTVIRSAERVIVALDNAMIYGGAGEYAAHRISYYNIYFPDYGDLFSPAYFTNSPMQEWGKMLRNYYNAVTPQIWKVDGIGFHPPQAPSVNYSRVFPEEGTASIFRPLTMRVEVVGSSIAYGDSTFDQIQEDGSILRLSTERILTTAIIDGEQVLINQWNSGVTSKSYSWDVTLPVVTDGSNSSNEHLVFTETIAFLDGRYREPGSEIWNDVVVTFDRKTGKFSRVINRASDSDALAVVDIAPGLEFQTYSLMVTPDYRVISVPGNVYTWPEEGLSWAWQPAPSGRYNVGLLMTAFGGTDSFASYSIDVDNDGLLPEETTIRAESNVSLGSIIPRWDDWTWPAYFREYDFTRTDNEEGTENITIYFSFPWDLSDEDAAAFGQEMSQTLDIILNTMLTKYDRKMVGEPVETTLSGFPALRFEYTYKNEEGIFNGIGYAYYHEARGRGMVLSAEALEGIGDLDKASELLANRFGLIDTSNLTDISYWSFDYYDEVEYAIPRDWDYFEDGMWRTYAPGGDPESPIFISLNEVTGYANSTDINDLLDNLTNDLVMEEFEITGKFTYNGTNHTWEAVLYNGIRKEQPVIGRIYGTTVGARSYAVWIETLDNDDVPDVFADIFEPIIVSLQIQETEPPEGVGDVIGIDAESTDEAAILLRYNRQSIVLYNRWPGENSVDISGLSFVFTLAEGDPVEFSAMEWEFGDLSRFSPGDCYQLWMPLYSDVSGSVPPADICVWRQGYITTQSPFWLGDEEGAEFEVKLRGETIAVCPTTPNISDEEFATGDVDFGEEIRCLVDVQRAIE